MNKLKFLFLGLCMIVALVGCPSPVVDEGGSDGQQYHLKKRLL